MRYLKVGEDMMNKKKKFDILRDDQGNVVFPMVVNNSLTICNIGYICNNP